MERDKHQTEVVFRIDKEGIVFAMFPHEVATLQGHVTSYEHIGQHSSADYKGCIRTTKKATPEQALPLYEELERLGYNLVVVRRQNYTKFLRELMLYRNLMR